MIYWNLTINALYFIHSSHYMTPHQKYTIAYHWSKFCQENPIGTSKRIVLTELKVALEYEIVSHLKSYLTEFYENRTKNIMEIKWEILRNWLWMVTFIGLMMLKRLWVVCWQTLHWRFGKWNSAQLNLLQAITQPVQAITRSTNSGNKGTNAKPITRAEYQSWRNTRLHFKYWVSHHNLNSNINVEIKETQSFF